MYCKQVKSFYLVKWYLLMLNGLKYQLKADFTLVRICNQAFFTHCFWFQNVMKWQILCNNVTIVHAFFPAKWISPGPFTIITKKASQFVLTPIMLVVPTDFGHGIPAKHIINVAVFNSLPSRKLKHCFVLYKSFLFRIFLNIFFYFDIWSLSDLLTKKTKQHAHLLFD
jgi:hypothetical protein